MGHESNVVANWREQYERIKRWKERLWIDPILHGDDAFDTFYAFTQACYHLVDWLENDRSQAVRRADAEAHVASSAPLLLCRDICNGSKHARLEAKGVSTLSKTGVAGSYTMERDDGTSQEVVINETRLFVGWGETFVDIEQFGALCVQEWERFLRARGLL